jgi:mRNA-degrading endonuclease RelE of RelBE toxin-antitoxin system
MSEPPKRPKEVAETPHAAPDAQEVATEQTYVQVGFDDDAKAIFDRFSAKERNGLLRKLAELARNPDGGKPLIKGLLGYYRVTYGRIRAVARTAENVLVVYVLWVAPRHAGSKKDPYAVASARLKRGDKDVREAFAKLIEARLSERKNR